MATAAFLHLPFSLLLCATHPIVAFRLLLRRQHIP